MLRSQNYMKRSIAAFHMDFYYIRNLISPSVLRFHDTFNSICTSPTVLTHSRHLFRGYREKIAHFQRRLKKIEAQF